MICWVEKNERGALLFQKKFSYFSYRSIKKWLLFSMVLQIGCNKSTILSKNCCSSSQKMHLFHNKRANLQKFLTGHFSVYWIIDRKASNRKTPKNDTLLPSFRLLSVRNNGYCSKIRFFSISEKRHLIAILSQVLHLCSKLLQKMACFEICVRKNCCYCFPPYTHFTFSPFFIRVGKFLVFKLKMI